MSSLLTIVNNEKKYQFQIQLINKSKKNSKKAFPKACITIEGNSNL